MTAVPVAQASCELGISRSQVLRDIAAGAPVARRGGRGRGRQTLIDPVAFAAWRRLQSTGDVDALRALAGELPELLADAMHDAFLLVTGPHKRAVAGALAGA